MSLRGVVSVDFPDLPVVDAFLLDGILGLGTNSIASGLKFGLVLLLLVARDVVRLPVRKLRNLLI